MRLTTLSRISLVALTVGMTAAVWIGLTGWRDAGRVNAELSRLFELRREVSQIELSIDYVTMLRGGSADLAGIEDRARLLAEEVRAVDHPQARVAAQHLVEIGHIAVALGANGMPSSLLGGDAEGRATLIDLVRQLQIHENGLSSAFQRVVAERHHSLSRKLQRDLGSLLAMAIFIGMPAVVALVVLYFRIHGPLEAFGHGIRRLGEGKEDVRIDVDSRDELGDLARSFNVMSARLRQRSQSLHDSEQRFRELAEHIRDVFWVYDPAGHRILYISPAFEEVFGVPERAVYEDADAWQRTILDEDLDDVRAFADRRAVQADEIRYRIQRPDGSIRYIQDRAFPVHDEHGEVLRITGVARDITELVQHEVELRERAKEQACLYRTQAVTADSTRPVPEILADIAGFVPRYLLHERSAVARIVFGGDEFRSAEWREPPQRFSTQIAVDSRAECFIEVGYVREEIAVANGHGPFMAEEVRLIEAVASNISHMIRARRMAETLSQTERLHAIGELTGGVAHDFNNLLTVIEGNAEMLVERLDEDGEDHELAKMVLDAAERGSRLTARLLAFARRQPLEPREVNINRQLRNMLPLLERTLGEGVRVELDFGALPWTAMIDPTQLETAVLNLAINARDAMPEGGTLSISTGTTELAPVEAAGEDRPEAVRFLQVVVADTGTGIPSEEQEHVFEPFYTTKEHGRGTGLGLSMVYGFVRQSRGDVILDSEPGRGTTVKLLLPRSGPSDDAPEPPAEGRKESLEGRGRTVLVVDDDASVRQYAARVLIERGFRVLEAEEGAEALDVLQANDDVDAIVTDVVMEGGMNGPEVAERARTLRPGLPVVFMSGYARDEVASVDRFGDGVSLLGKPFRREELADKLGQALTARQRQGAALD